MKIRINRQTLAQLPPPLREQVAAFRSSERSASFSVEYRRKVFCQEDATYRAFSPDFAISRTAQAAGEHTPGGQLSPTAEIELPDGCTVVEVRTFLGKRFLTVYHNPAAGSRLTIGSAAA